MSDILSTSLDVLFRCPPGTACGTQRGTVELRWSDADPHAVRMTFGPREPQWVLGRDLLAAGLDAPAGGHDVTVLRDPWDTTRVLIVLAAPSGRLSVSVDAVDLDLFVQGTDAHVPVSPAELDAELAELLRQAEDGSVS